MLLFFLENEERSLLKIKKLMKKVDMKVCQAVFCIYVFMEWPFELFGTEIYSAFKKYLQFQKKWNKIMIISCVQCSQEKFHLKSLKKWEVSWNENSSSKSKNVIKILD